MPGNFTVRGDWYLAVARGSRSERLGWHAIDLLSSRRENVRRLRLGLGLPTRDYLPDGNDHDQSGELISALREPEGEGSRSLRYKDIIAHLAASDAGEAGETRRFHWLFRSAIPTYSMHSRVWGHWLSRVLVQCRDWCKTDGVMDGFVAYDMVKLKSTPQLKSYGQFVKEVDYAEAALTSASHSP